MKKFDITTLGPAEKEAYSAAATYLNELSFIKNTQTRKSAKKVKGKRKKQKEVKKKHNIKEPTALHAFEATIGQLKMKIVTYLKMECTPNDIISWVYGITPRGATGFVRDLREPMSAQIVDIIKGNYVFRVPLDVHKWLFKSGFMKRSNKIFEEHYHDGIDFSYSDDIINLKNKYNNIAISEVHNKDFEHSGLKSDTVAMEEDLRFLMEVKTTYAALKLMVEDIDINEDTMKKIKYITTRVGTLEKIMLDFINEGTEDIEHTNRVIEEAIKENEYRRQFGKFSEYIKLSCKISGIDFKEENDSIYRSYYEDLKNFTDKELRKELHWLKGEALGDAA